jgi:protein-tyrosine phosphatase
LTIMQDQTVRSGATGAEAFRALFPSIALDRKWIPRVEIPTPVDGRVLVVCTGNVCRSPAITALLRAGLERTGIDVASAGVKAQEGAPVDATMLGLMPPAVRAELDGITARVLAPEQIEHADVILTATRAHRSSVVRMVPSAVRRTFTVREFAHYAALVEARQSGRDEEPLASIADVVERVPYVRASPRLADKDFDLPDPFGRSARVYRKAYAMVEDASATIARVLSSVGAPAEQ